MSICVAFNLSDGVVIAVDSATTIFDADGAISKVFPDAEKIFRLQNLRIGIATYGIAALHGRTIGSFIREFSVAEQSHDLGNLDLREIVERLRSFIRGYYVSYLEEIYKQPFEDIPVNRKGILGIVVGGFSAGSFQSEVWEIVTPVHEEEYSGIQHFPRGTYGCHWFALSEPIHRYANGIDAQLSVRIREIFQDILGRELSAEELGKFNVAIEEHRYRFNFNGMPIQSGVDCAKFLVNIVLGHYRFAEPHPIVGGVTTVGVIRYDHNEFQILG